MQVRPLHDRVLVKRVEEKEVVKGGIIIPDTAKEKPMEGEVVAVGDGKILEDGKRVALDVKPGNRVLFGKYAGTEIKIEDQDYVIMREEEILAIIESKKGSK
ncbi:MAG: groS [Acidobacteria bacterium]|jgi:chaperonin GroES|nr:groS [Acidobacteriota bacterium]